MFVKLPNNKARKSFESLQNEMQVMSVIEQAQIGGGIGVVTSGTGTLEDPFIITSNFYYDDNIMNAEGAVTGLSQAIGAYNDLPAFTDGSGKYYKYNFSAQHSENATLAARNDTIDVLGNGAALVQAGVSISTNGSFAQNEFGEASVGGTKIGINASKINDTYNYGFGFATGTNSGESGNIKPEFSIEEFHNKNFQHEIAHTLGMTHHETDDNASPVLQNFTQTVKETKKLNNSGEEYTVIESQTTTPGDIDNNTSSLIINKAKQNAQGSGTAGRRGIINWLDETWKNL